MSAVWPRRVPLTAGVAVEVYPPIAGHHAVRIGNATPGDLRVYQNPNDDTTYFVITSGDEEDLNLRTIAVFPANVAFYLYAVQSGTAVLIWQ